MMNDEDRQQIARDIEAVIEASDLGNTPFIYAIGARDAFRKCLAIVHGEAHVDTYQGGDKRKSGPRLFWESAQPKNAP